MKRLVSCLAAVVLLLTMTACGAENDGSAVGTWEAEIDYAGVINAIVSQNEVLAASGATLDSAPVKVTYTFAEDGTASCVLDQEQLYAGLSVMFEEILTPVIAALGGMTLEEYIANTKLSREEMLVSLFTEEVMTAIKNAVSFTGTYTVAGQRLTVTANNAQSRTAFTLDGDTLTLETPIGTTTANDAQKDAVKALYPLSLKKVG